MITVEGQRGYGATGLPKPFPKEAPQPGEFYLMLSQAVIVFTSTSATYYFWALLPAWEADPTLDWSIKETTTVNWSTTLCEAFGLLLARPLADYIEPVHLICLEGVSTFLGMFIAATLTSSSSIIMTLLVVNFTKGILWPSLGTIIFQTIHAEKQDSFFFCCALSSRLSGAIGDITMGQILKWGFSWRSAIYSFGGVLFVAFIVSIVALGKTLSRDIHDESSDMSPSWRASYGAKWCKLVSDFAGWLALAVLVGSSVIWALAGYLAVMMKQKFTMTSGGAAMAASSLLMGTFFGLLLAGYMTWVHGRRVGRIVQLIQAAVGLGAFSTLCFIPSLGMWPWMSCLLVAGAGFGPLIYLPYCVYCATVPRGQRAFSMAVLDSMSTASSVTLRLLFGKLRIDMPHQAGEMMYNITAAGLVVATLATSMLYLRRGADESHTF